MPPDICEVFFYLCVTILSHHEELSLHLVLLTQDRNVQDFPLTFRNILSPILHLFFLLKLSKTQESGLIRSHVKNPFFFEVLDKFPRFFFFLIHVTDYQFLLGPFVNCYRYFTYRLFLHSCEEASTLEECSPRLRLFSFLTPFTDFCVVMITSL